MGAKRRAPKQRGAARRRAKRAAQASSSESSSSSESESDSSSSSSSSSSSGVEVVHPAEADPFSAMSAENRAAWARFWQDWRVDTESEPSECSADEGLSDVSTADTELFMELAEEAPFETLLDRHPEWFEPEAEPPTAGGRARSDAAEPEQTEEDEIWDELLKYGVEPDDVNRAAQEMEARLSTPPPPTYLEALSHLPDPWDEQAFLWSFGETKAEVQVFLEKHLNMDPAYVQALMEGWLMRRSVMNIFRFVPGGVSRFYFQKIRGLADPEKGMRAAYDRQAAPPKPIKIARAPRIPSTATGRESVLDRRELDYKDTVHFIITETRTLAAELGLRPFPHVPVDASVETVAATYGYAITSKAYGGVIQLRGLRTRWNRLRRFLDAAADAGEATVPFACYFIDSTKLTGMAKVFEWAADALGLELFREFARDPAIKLRQPRRGWCAEAPSHTPKKAPWVSDRFIIYLAYRATHAVSSEERVRAFFFYVLAVGGVRFGDAQHVVKVQINEADVTFTASRFKATRGDSVEHFTVPLKGPAGCDFRDVAREMKAQMRAGFLLAHPSAPELVDSLFFNCAGSQFGAQGDSVDRFSQAEGLKPCSYQAAVGTLRAFALRYLTLMAGGRAEAAVPGGRPVDQDVFADADKITMHSLRSWLATVCFQLEVPERETNLLLHWTSKEMVRCYAKNTSAVETANRSRIVAILDGDWRSAGPGMRLASAACPSWDELKNRATTRRF